MANDEGLLDAACAAMTGPTLDACKYAVTSLRHTITRDDPWAIPELADSIRAPQPSTPLLAEELIVAANAYYEMQVIEALEAVAGGNKPASRRWFMVCTSLPHLARD